MEILIDTNVESPEGIRNAIRMLQSLIAFEIVESDRPKAAPSTLPHAAPSTGMDSTAAQSQNDTNIKHAAAILAPPPPPPPAPPGVETDSTGAVWSSKLHTSTKTKDIDGKWKPRKPRDSTPPPPPTLDNVAAAHGLQRLPASLPASTLVPPPPPPPPSVMPQQSGEDPEVNVDDENDTGGAGMVPPGPPQGLTQPPAITFADFIPRLTSGMNDGSITQTRIAEVQKQFGLTSLFSLNDTEAAKLADVAAAFGFTA